MLLSAYKSSLDEMGVNFRRDSGHRDGQLPHISLQHQVAKYVLECCEPPAELQLWGANPHPIDVFRVKAVELVNYIHPLNHYERLHDEERVLQALRQHTYPDGTVHLDAAVRAYLTAFRPDFPQSKYGDQNWSSPEWARLVEAVVNVLETGELTRVLKKPTPQVRPDGYNPATLLSELCAPQEFVTKSLQSVRQLVCKRFNDRAFKPEQRTGAAVPPLCRGMVPTNLRRTWPDQQIMHKWNDLRKRMTAVHNASSGNNDPAIESVNKSLLYANYLLTKSGADVALGK